MTERKSPERRNRLLPIAAALISELPLEATDTANRPLACHGATPRVHHIMTAVSPLAQFR